MTQSDICRLMVGVEKPEHIKLAIAVRDKWLCEHHEDTKQINAIGGLFRRVCQMVHSLEEGVNFDELGRNREREAESFFALVAGEESKRETAMFVDQNRRSQRVHQELVEKAEAYLNSN